MSLHEIIHLTPLDMRDFYPLKTSKKTLKVTKKERKIFYKIPAVGHIYLVYTPSVHQIYILLNNNNYLSKLLALVACNLTRVDTSFN